MDNYLESNKKIKQSNEIELMKKLDDIILKNNKINIDPDYEDTIKSWFEYTKHHESSNSNQNEPISGPTLNTNEQNIYQSDNREEFKSYFYVPDANQEALNEILDKNLKAFSEFEWFPGMIFCTYEAEYLITNWANKESLEWFIENIPEQLRQIYPIVIQKTNLPKISVKVSITSENLNCNQIFARFARMNKEAKINTSRWTLLGWKPSETNKYKIYLNLSIDPKSAEIIKKNESKLFYGMERVKFTFEKDKLSEAARDIIPMEQD